ncbi:hypothetical protein FSP39_021250 [Pinctada imbricata]|uniref:Homeobox domain-containing protein n=1 Tax=Pinctada imbricata TaxID=66713 RepID=A0AA88XSD1_PINIB|nr:hypothetical protein FSP39_021250 [Pinctada imbricata]
MSMPSRSDHLVCTDPLCPTTCDPYTGRILCRCYQQMQDTRSSYQPNGQVAAPPPPAYNSMYPQNYHSMEPTLAAASALQPPQPPAPPRMDNGVPFPPTTTLAQFPSNLSPTLASTSNMSNVGTLDTLLRSQVYNYMNSVQYANLDLNGSRRKNATRESTAALKAWLKEHRKNPYPTKAEKVMLAIVTKMSLTQISTWFANARRRLKKENGGELKPLDGNENSNSSDDDNTSDSSLFTQATQRLQENEGGASPGFPSVDALRVPQSMTPITNGTPEQTLSLPPALDFQNSNGLPPADLASGSADSLPVLLAGDSDIKQQSTLPSFSTFMGNSNQPTMDYPNHFNNCQSQTPCDQSSMYGLGSFNTTAYSTSDFSSAGTGSYMPNYGYDSVANYFKQHPQFAHEYNSTGSDKENIHLPATQMQQNGFLIDSLTGKSSDSDSSGQKSTDSSPSSVKSKIWSITEIIGSSMSKIMDGTEQPLPAFTQTLASTDQ